MRFCMCDAEPLSFNMLTRKAKFFMNDRWILVGEIQMSQDKNHLSVQMPNVEEFLNSREHLDDGTLDWFEWGPRVN